MSTGAATNKSPSVRGQLATCVLLSALAITITLWFQGAPAFHQWRTGRSVLVEIGVLLVFAAAGYLVLFVGLRITFITRRIELSPTLAAIDVSGFKPLLFGLAAGIGE